MTGVLLFTHEQSKRIQAETQIRMRMQAIRLKEQRIGKVIAKSELRRIPQKAWSWSGVAGAFRFHRFAADPAVLDQ